MSWKSSKQDKTAISTVESGYIAASEAAKEAIWIKSFLMELGVVLSSWEPVKLYCDENTAVAQAKEPRSHNKSKHKLRKYHLLREVVMRGDVAVSRIATDEYVADPCTKGLPQQKHEKHVRNLGLV